MTSRSQRRHILGIKNVILLIVTVTSITFRGEYKPTAQIKHHKGEKGRRLS